MPVGARSDKRIKVIRIIGRLNVGGPAIHVVNLTAGLNPTQYEPVLVAGRESSAEGSMAEFASLRGVRPIVIPEMVTTFTPAPRDATALRKLYSLLRREQPDIVHTHTAKAGFLGRIAARLAGVPVVVHTFHGHVLHGYYGPVKSELLRRIEQCLALCTDKLVTVSEQVKKDLVNYRIAPAQKIAVVPLGFDLQPYFDSHRHAGEFRREMNLEPEDKLIGIVGRLFPIKNHALFLEAAARIAREDARTRFVTVGDGILRSALERQARSLGIADRVRFTGWRHDLPRIYADLNMLLVTSDNEGTPVAAIEAMAAGCPVVATRVGGLPDLIEDGRTGRLVPPRDVTALAVAVLDLLRRPQHTREMVNKAAGAVRERFAATRLINDVHSLYGELLEAKAIGSRVRTTERMHLGG